jgi:crotonobetainyl-CoA:carnitine CoA-transferase CaiB-like acyl-CoA transferase
MAALPLEGVRVVDLTVVWSGPTATRLMAALGAEVIRPESIKYYPHSSRGPQPYPPPETIRAAKGLAAAYPGKEPGPDPYNRYGSFLLVSQGKLSCTMELSDPAGREAFNRLIACSDVLVENNSRMLSSTLGLEWDELSAINPRLILVKMTPMGLDGPYARAIGYGAQFESITGMAWLRGHPDAPPNDTDATYHMDDVAPQGVLFAVLAALMLRERTGRGQLIEFPQAEFLMQGLGDVFLGVTQEDGRQFGPDGNRDPNIVQGIYPCHGDDQWIAISLRDDQDWAALVAAAGHPEWAGAESFGTAASRRQHQDVLDALLAAWTAPQDKQDLFRKLQAAGIPAAPVYDEADAYADPHFRSRGVFVPVPHPTAGTFDYPGLWARWPGLEPRTGVPAPRLGEHNEYVYTELLGYSAEEYQHMVDAGLIGTSYPRPAAPG